MICLYQNNSCIFDVLLTYILNDATTKAKTKREPTVASTAVNHVHRMCVGSRDSLPLFNQNQFIMLPTNDKCNRTKKLATTADEIINNFANTSAKARTTREILKQMCAASQKGDDDEFTKDIFVLYYEDFDKLLKAIEIFKINTITNN